MRFHGPESSLHVMGAPDSALGEGHHCHCREEQHSDRNADEGTAAQQANLAFWGITFIFGIRRVWAVLLSALGHRMSCRDKALLRLRQVRPTRGENISRMAQARSGEIPGSAQFQSALS